MPRPGQVARLRFEGTVGAAKVLDFSNILAMPSGEIVQMKVAQPDGIADGRCKGARTRHRSSRKRTHPRWWYRACRGGNSIAATISLTGSGEHRCRWQRPRRRFPLVELNGNVGLMTFIATAGQDLGLGLVIVPDYPYCCDASEDAEISLSMVLTATSFLRRTNFVITADGSIVILDVTVAQTF